MKQSPFYLAISLVFMFIAGLYAEESIKISALQYEVALENGEDVEVVLDAQGNIIHAEASNEDEQDDEGDE